MTPIPMNGRVRPRRRLLAGSSAALALTLAANAAEAQRLDANAIRLATNDQAAPGGSVLASVTGASLSTMTGPVWGAKIEVSDNMSQAAAVANQADQAIALDTQASDGPIGTAILASDTQSISGSAGALIANRQTGGYLDVMANTFDTRIEIGVGGATGSQIEAAGNTLLASAHANFATADVATSGTAGSAGIVNLQTMAPQSTTAARAWRGVTLVTDALSASSVTTAGNALSADASGNQVDNHLSISGESLATNTTSIFPSVVHLGVNGSAAAYADAAILANQSQGGVVKARAGTPIEPAAFLTTIRGDASDAAVTSDRNLISANAEGNRSSNALLLDARILPPVSGQASGAVANVTNDQRAQSTGIAAVSTGGGAIDFGGAVQDSTASSSNNTAQAIATANLATGNRLSISAIDIDAGASAFRVGAQFDGSANVGAAFGVQNVQDFDTTPVSAGQFGDTASITAAGPVDGAKLTADGNAALVAATGNQAVNDLTLATASLAASAALNNVQAGNGNLGSVIGTPNDPGGARIAANGNVTNSMLSTSDNSAIGTTLGNSATNTMDVKASDIGHVDAGGALIAGVAAGGYGARTPFALASYQRLGQPATGNALTPTISSTVAENYGVQGAGPVKNSSVTIAGNSSAANALGNTVRNRLTLDAGMVAADTGPSLASTQSGDANVAASVTTASLTPSALDGSVLSVTGNRTTALAAINDADSALASASSGETGNVLPATITWTPQFQVTASAGRILVNHQSATGSATASATTNIGGSQAPLELTGARAKVADNTTIAEASANRAINAIATSVPGAASDALANSQTSNAQVTSAVQAFATNVVPAGILPGVADSTIRVEGNTASALARGNAAENSLSVDTLGNPAGTGAFAALNASARVVGSNAVLYSNQINSGAIAAAASGAGYGPLGGANAAQNASMMASNNSVTASAYGNSVVNTVAVAVAPLPAALASFQQNSGSVTAQISGAGFNSAFGPLTAGALSITGNQLAATAVGNEASSVITTLR